MGYELGHRASIDADIVRIMSEQLAKADRALDTVDDDPEQALHECRKRCKKIRGAVRLVRPAVSGDLYARVNGLARDAARELAGLRDVTAMATTFDRLAARWPSSAAGSDAVGAIACALSTRRRASVDEVGADHPAIARARNLLSDLGDAIDGTCLDHTGFDAIGPGLAKSYGRGRRALATAVEAPTAANFHDWRKRAKYTRYHVDLLAPSAPTILPPLGRAFHRLTDALGDAHDLAVIGAWLRNDGEIGVIDGVAPDDISPDDISPDDISAVRVLVDGARSELEHRAVSLGYRLYAEPPKRFTKRLGAYWEAWRSEGSRSPAGDLDLVLGDAVPV